MGRDATSVRFCRRSADQVAKRLRLVLTFDLPIALGMLKLEESNRVPDLESFCISGELALSGELRPVKGVLSIALEARRRNRRTLIVPLQNAPEAAVVEGVEVYGATSLAEARSACPWHVRLRIAVKYWLGASSSDVEFEFHLTFSAYRRCFPAARVRQYLLRSRTCYNRNRAKFSRRPPGGGQIRRSLFASILNLFDHLVAQFCSHLVQRLNRLRYVEAEHQSVAD